MNFKFVSAFFLIAFFSAASTSGQTFLQERPFEAKSRSWEKPFLIPEYVLRTAFFPLQKLIEWDEKYFLRKKAIEFFSNEDKTIFLYPTFFYSSRDGFWFGAQYRHRKLFNDKDFFKAGFAARANGDFDANGSYTVQELSGSVKRLSIAPSYKKDSNSKFFGLGPQTISSDETIFERESFVTGIEIDLSSPWLSLWKVSLGLNLENHSTAQGNTKDGRPLADVVLPAGELRGFGLDLSYTIPSVQISYDTRPEKANPTRGGYISVKYDQASSSDVNFSFNELYIQTGHLIELEASRRALAFGLRHKAVSSKAPFFKLASLGQNEVLRGYGNNRFVDRNFLAGNIEYRYKVWETLEPANAYGLGTLFLDAGQVYGDFNEVSFENTQISGGVGFSIGVGDRLLYRMQLALGGEGLSFIFAANQAF